MNNKAGLPLKKYSHAKILFSYASSLLDSPKPLSHGVALNILHDVVEFAFIALEEQLEINEKTYEFKGHITKIEEKFGEGKLPHSRNLIRLNNLRNSFKHHAIIPERETIHEMAFYVKDFLEETCLQFFEIDFSEIGLVSFIENKEIKSYIESAEQALKENNLDNVAESCGVGYALAKADLHKASLFNRSFCSNGFGIDLGDNTHRHLKSWAENIQSEVQKTQHIIDLNLLGIDYKQTQKFHQLTPVVQFTQGGVIYMQWFVNKNQLNKESSQFCIDFLIDFTLKVQNKQP